VKALREVGAGRAARYGAWQAFAAVLDHTPTPQLRAALLRAAGARIGRATVVQPRVRFQNADRHRGLAALTIGSACWLGYDVDLDLAQDVWLGDQVTFASRVHVNTHLNVGYADHPLQAVLPPSASPVRVERGSFVGTGAILLAGTHLRERTAVAAGAVVSGEHPPGVLLGGVPARVLRTWDGAARGRTGR
jgi:acetyltransferase-like isoleucine patch superfamily enzyme